MQVLKKRAFRNEILSNIQAVLTIIALFLITPHALGASIEWVYCQRLLTAADLLNQTAIYTKTTEQSHLIDSDFGTPLNVINRIGPQYHSLYTSGERDTMLDPRIMAIYMGAEGSYVLGYSKRGESQVTIPTATHLQVVVPKINRILVRRGAKPIPVEAIEADSEPLLQSTYLEDVIYRHLIHLASVGDLAIHDTLHVSGAFFIPVPIFIEGLSKFSKFYSFYQILVKKAGTSENKKFMDLILKATITRMDHFLSMGNWDFGYYLTTGSEKPSQGDFAQSYQSFLSDLDSFAQGTFRISERYISNDLNIETGSQEVTNFLRIVSAEWELYLKNNPTSYRKRNMKVTMAAIEKRRSEIGEATAQVYKNLMRRIKRDIGGR